MATKKINVKRGDTKQYITDTLTLGGAVLDLTTATAVVMVVKKSPVLRKECDIVNAVAGTIRKRLDNDLSGVAGDWPFEWEAVFPDGKVTIPTEGYHTLHVSKDLG